MKRKLVKQGAATMMVSLPAKWIKRFNLDKGDEIDLEERDKGLIITADKSISSGKKVEVDVSDLYPLINRALIAMYDRGLDEIEIKFGSREQIIDFQKKVLPELIGFEIIKQSQFSVILKDIAGSGQQEMGEIIKRLFLIVDSMADELISSAEKKQEIDAVIDMDMTVNRFAHFCLRILSKKGYPEFHKTPQVYSIISTLEEIGDTYKKIAIEIKKDKQISKEEITKLKEIRSLMMMFEKLFFNFSKKEAVSFAKKYDSIKSNLKDKGMINLYLHILNDTVVKMMGYLLTIVEI